MRTRYTVLAALFSALILSNHSNAFAYGPCTNTFPNGVSYLPSVPQCDGNAAVVLFGEYYNSFSVVVRDCNNNDRDPCDKGEDSCASNASSPFKAQKVLEATIRRNNRKARAQIYCMKERGDSEVFKLVRRITIKRTNPVRTDKDVSKICLRTRTNAVRVVDIIKTSRAKNISSTGYNSACPSQPYLACSIAYADICPSYN